MNQVSKFFTQSALPVYLAKQIVARQYEDRTIDASTIILGIENRGDRRNIVLPAIKDNKIAVVLAPNSEYFCESSRRFKILSKHQLRSIQYCHNMFLTEKSVKKLGFPVRFKLHYVFEINNIDFSYINHKLSIQIYEKRVFRMFSIQNFEIKDEFSVQDLSKFQIMSTQAGGLIGILRNLRKNKKQQLRILVLGLDNAGKTTILKSLSNEDISTITPTQGFNIKNLTHDKFKLNVWDIGGQKALREYWGNYFTNTDALVYVIDSADTKRVKEAGQELEKLLQEKELANAPLLIFANKQDLVQALQPDEIIQTLKTQNLGNRKWTITACSAKTQEGLEDGLTWLVENVKK